jgi:hypothetical protein
MAPCMLRTTYQRGAGEGSRGWKAARRRTMRRKYSAHRWRVHSVFGEARYCMVRSHAAEQAASVRRWTLHLLQLGDNWTYSASGC